MSDTPYTPLDKPAARREEQQKAVINSVFDFLAKVVEEFREIYTHGEGALNLDMVSIHKEAHSHIDTTTCCSALRSLKKVLSGPLDSFLLGGSSWFSPFLSSHQPDVKFGLVATWASAKKVMPVACRCSRRGIINDFVDLASTPFVPNRRYLRYVQRETRRIFRSGWDRNYHYAVSSNSIPFTACSEAPRANGSDQSLGAFGVIKKREADDISWGITKPGSTWCKLIVVPSSGKSRVLVKTPASWNGLRPLHKTIYSRLSKTKWLLRGNPRDSVNRVVKKMKKNELFLSGDYESATDFLSTEVAELMLDTMAETSGLPVELWESARETLRPLIHLPDDYKDPQGRSAIVLRRGQMMGSLLSFPLLCLQNYCATTYILGKDRPLLINGDDLLTCVTRNEYRRWLTELPNLGLKPSAGKTGLSRSFFTINSTYFKLVGRRAYLAPFFRFKSLLHRGIDLPTQYELEESAGGLKGILRINYERQFLQAKRMWITRSSRRMKDLGLSVRKAAIPAWLMARESGYMGLPDSMFRPLPSRPEIIVGLGIPTNHVVAPNYIVSSDLKREQGPMWAHWKDIRRGYVDTLDERKTLEAPSVYLLDLRVTGIHSLRTRGSYIKKYMRELLFSPINERNKKKRTTCYVDKGLLRKIPIPFVLGSH